MIFPSRVCERITELNRYTQGWMVTFIYHQHWTANKVANHEEGLGKYPGIMNNALNSPYWKVQRLKSMLARYLKPCQSLRTA